MRCIFTLCLLAAATARAQTEFALNAYFEGKSVVLKLDVPAGKDGLEVYPKAEPKLDFKRYLTHLHQFGPSLLKGDSATISAVRVKDKSIEIQLAGRGYGILSDDTSSTPFSSAIPKPPQAPLTHALGNARFTIWYPDKSLKVTVPRPEELLQILSEYVDFGTGVRGPRTQVSPVQPDVSNKLKRGMTQSQVLDILGVPRRSQEHMEGDVVVVTNTFQSVQNSIEVDFVKNLVVAFRVRPRQ
jgi:hypothetical protein